MEIEEVLGEPKDREYFGKIKKLTEVDGFEVRLSDALCSMIVKLKENANCETILEKINISWFQLSKKNKFILEEFIQKDVLAHIFITYCKIIVVDSMMGGFGEFLRKMTEEREKDKDE